MPIRKKKSPLVKVTRVSSIQLTLTLTELQAKWLKGLMQNPDCHPDDEREELAEIRKAIFMAIQESQ